MEEPDLIITALLIIYTLAVDHYFDAETAAEVSLLLFMVREKHSNHKKTSQP